MTQQLELPESLVKAAEEKKWPLDLVHQGISAGIAAARIEQIIRSGVSPDMATQMLNNMRAGAPGATLQNLQANITPGSAGPPPLDMSWADVPTERGFFPNIGANGLGLDDVEQSSYGIIPDYWPYENDMPRGSFMPPEAGNLAASYSILQEVGSVGAAGCLALRRGDP